MAKPKKIQVKFIDSFAAVKPSKTDDDIKKAMEEKQNEADEDCPFC